MGKAVVVDDFVPIYENTKQHVFANLLRNDAWAVLLEKALAKLFGSY